MCSSSSSSIGGGGGSDAGEQIENGFSRCGVAGSFERRRTKAFAGLFAAGCYPAAIFRPSRSAWKLQCAFGDTPICAKRARVYVRACARVRHVWVSTCAHDTAVPTCLPPPTHRRTSSIASPSPLSFRPLNLLVSSFLPSTSPFPFPSAPKLEKDEEGRRAQHFFDEIRMYVPPYPDLLRGIRRVQERRRGLLDLWIVALTTLALRRLLKMSYTSSSLLSPSSIASEWARCGEVLSASRWIFYHKGATLRDDRIDLLSLSIPKRIILRVLLGVLLDIANRRVHRTNEETREKEKWRIWLFRVVQVPLPVGTKLQLGLQPRVEQPRNQENWNRNYRSYRDPALPPRVFEDLQDILAAQGY